MSQGEFLLYQTEDAQTRVQLRLQDETVWVTQKQLAELYQKDVRTINEHIKNCYADGELDPDRTIRKLRIVGRHDPDGGNQGTIRHRYAEGASESCSSLTLVQACIGSCFEGGNQTMAIRITASR